MLSADSSILWSRPEEMPGPEQIDAWLQKRVPGGRVYPRIGLGAAYCLWGRVYGVRPEVLVAQGAQECYFYREYENTHWIQWNNPAGMVYYTGRFTPCDCIPGHDVICAQPTPWNPVAPREQNRDGRTARFATKRHGVKAHCCYARRVLVERNISSDIATFVRKGWAPADPEPYIRNVVAWANEIRAQPRLKPPGIRDEYTQYALVNLMGLGIMQGYPDGYLRSEWPLTRAEMAALLMRAFGYALWHKKQEVATPPDVRGHWAERDIRRVMQAGWMSGYPDGSFKPDNFITRAEVCAVLFNIGSLPRFVYRGPQRFPDVTPDKWHYRAVMWAYQNGWLGEFVGKFGERYFTPDFPISRGEVAHLLWQMVKVFYPPLTGGIRATAGPQQREEKLVPAVWIGTERKWVPAWAAPLFVSEAEAFERPVTAVPAVWVASPAETVGRKPLVILGAAAAGIAAGAGVYFLLKE